jgi:TRAP transporter 4TM/12TM fusion protein
VFEKLKKVLVPVLSVLLCLFVLFEVNYDRLHSQSERAVFAMFGLSLCFLIYPAHKKLEKNAIARWIDVGLIVGTIVTCGYVVVQTQPLFEGLWANGMSLANRAGASTSTDVAIGFVGLILVLEATRRSIGWIVPLLALAFVGHSYYCYASIQFNWPELPLWMLPSEGQDISGIVETTYLQTLGVFGKASAVMFQYVFLFVVFGSFLEMSGATKFIIKFAEKVFGGSPGGPAKISVLGSGLMGSLSGSAVANAVTTGAFTIPMMRNSGFPKHIAGGITAAAAAGGALVPPVMGAGAYMMLEMVPDLNGDFMIIVRAAIIPALLYYFSIYLIVHFQAKNMGMGDQTESTEPQTFGQKVVAFVIDYVLQRKLLLTLIRIVKEIRGYDAVVFFSALTILVGMLAWGFTPTKSVTASLIIILLLAVFRKELPLAATPRVLTAGAFVVAAITHQIFFADQLLADASTRRVFESYLGSALVGMFSMLVIGLIEPNWRPSILKALVSSARNGVSLVAASACVGIIIGIVQQSGVAAEFSTEIKGVVDESLFLALLGIMICSIVLGMGVPSVVCYLLMATLMASLLSELGVIPLVAHLFIFYFGMMSMVTPPVALAAYASASIAEAPVMQTAFAAFRFSLVGFTLPFMFVYRPELCLLTTDPAGLSYLLVAMQTGAAMAGVVALAAGLAGFFTRRLGIFARVGLFASAGLLLFPGEGMQFGDYNYFVSDIVGLVLLIVIFLIAQRTSEPERKPISEEATTAE